MRHAGLTNAPRGAFCALMDDEFRAAFNLRRLETGLKSFSHLIETDGVSMCVHLKREMTPEEKANAKRTGRQSPPPKRPCPQDPAPAPPPPGQRRVGGDPGRVNMMYAVESLEDGSEKKYVLTRRSYYSWGGIDQHNARAASWRREVEAEEGVYARHSPRTASLPQLVAFLDDYASVYDPLWANRLRRCWGQSRFRVYGLKRKALDRFVQSIRGDSEVKPLFAYGAGRFAPTGRGERAVPTTELEKAFRRHKFDVIMTDEHLTSQMCHACEERLQPVAKQSADGTIREVRGLRRCCSTDCERVSFKGRDHNAAQNILRCLKEAPRRPQYLSRDQPRSEVKTFVLREQAGAEVLHHQPVQHYAAAPPPGGLLHGAP